MGDTLVGLLIGWAICKVLGAGEGFLSDLFHVSHPSSGPAPLPSPSSTTTVVNFPTAVPVGLPPWPAGWKAAQTTPAVVQRAFALLPVMKLNDVKYEQGPAGGWLAYYKHQFSGKTGVTVHEPKVATFAPQPSISLQPSAAPVNVSNPTPSSPVVRPEAPTSSPATPVTVATPSGDRPILRKGSKGDAVKVWQRAIGVPDDGKFGAGTKRATQAWQSSRGLTPDGVVGPNTWATVPGAS